MNPRPTWREPMLWLVVGLPVASVLTGLLLVATAIRAGGADEVDDKVERHAQVQSSELAPDERARALQLSALVQVRPGRVELLPVSGDLPRNTALELRLRHPTDASQDRRLTLAPTAQGWGADVQLPQGHDWLLRLAPADGRWRLFGRLGKGAQATRVGPSLSSP